MSEKDDRGDGAPAAGLDCAAAVQRERDRIRAALEVRCGRPSLTRGGNPFDCALNKGHIGDCYPIHGTISVRKERLEEILNG